MTGNPAEDESLLLDYLLHRCDDAARREVAERLRRDQAFAALHEDLRHTFEALDLMAEYEPPSHLVRRAIRKIRRERRAELKAVHAELRRGAPRPMLSLREMAVVAAAALLVALVFVPAVHKARYRALIGQCASNTGEIGTALRTHANAHDGRLPLSDPSNGRWMPAGDQPAASNAAALFKLVKDGLTSPRTFQCPGLGGGEPASFDVRADMDNFPGSRYVSYSYQHAVGPASPTRAIKAEEGDVPQSMAILADHTPVFRDGRFLRDRVEAPASDNHDGAGQNVLYLDMHVAWKDRAEAGVEGNNIYLVDGLLDYRGDEAPNGPTDSFLLPAFCGKDLLPQQ